MTKDPGGVLTVSQLKSRETRSVAPCRFDDLIARFVFFAIITVIAFENHMNPFVKKTMLAAHPVSDVEQKSIDDFKAAKDEAKKELDNLPTSIRSAEQEKESARPGMSSAQPKDRNMLKQSIIKADKKLRGLKNFATNFVKAQQQRQKSFEQPQYATDST